MSRQLAAELVTHLEEIVGGHETARREIEEARERANRLHQQLMDQFQGTTSAEPFIPTFEQPKDPFALATRRIRINRLLMQLYAHSGVRSRLDQIFTLLNSPPAELSPPPMPQIPDFGTQGSAVSFLSNLNSGMSEREKSWDEMVRQEHGREVEALRLAREVLRELSQ